jgi:hypothetical protein
LASEMKDASRSPSPTASVNRPRTRRAPPRETRHSECELQLD